MAARSSSNVPPGAAIAVLAGAVFAAIAAGRALVTRAGARRGGAAAPARSRCSAPRRSRSAAAGPTAQRRRAVDVVATTTQLADIARAVGGDAVDVHQLLQPGHRPARLRAAARRRRGDSRAPNVVLASGLGLDDWIARSGRAGGHATREVVDLGARRPPTTPGRPTAARSTRTGGTTRATSRAAVLADPRALAEADPATPTSYRASARALPAPSSRRSTARIAALHARGAGGASASSSPTTTRSPTSPRATASRSSARSSRRSRRRRSRRPASVAELAGTIAARARQGRVPRELRSTPTLAERSRARPARRPTHALRRRARAARARSGATYLGMSARNADAMVRGLTGGGARMRDRRPVMRAAAEAPGSRSATAGRRRSRTSTFARRAGERIAVLGPNGGGKSTLFRALLGELPPLRGTLDGRGRAATVPQTERSRLDFPVSALDVALMGALARAAVVAAPGRAPSARGALDALARVGLADRAGATFGELSGGQRQRVLDRPRAGAGRAAAAARRAVHAASTRRAPSGWTRCSTSSPREGRARARRHPRRRAGARWDRVLCLNRRQIAFGPPRGARPRRARRDLRRGDRRAADGAAPVRADAPHHRRARP